MRVTSVLVNPRHIVCRILLLVSMIATGIPGRAWSLPASGASAAPAGNGLQHEVATEYLPFLGATLHHSKGRDPETGRPFAVTRIQNGQVTTDHGAALRAADAHLRWLERGAMAEPLWERAWSMHGSERTWVAIWLRVSEPAFDKEAIAKDVVGAQIAAMKSASARAAAQAGFLADAALAVEADFSIVDGAPVVIGQLRADEITALAWLPAVGWMDEVPAYAAQANTRQSWFDTDLVSSGITGKDGTGISVCVIENHLPISGATTPRAVFNSSGSATGDAAKHARAVAGAVRSQVTPAGAAHGAYVDIGNWNDSASIAPALNWCGATQNDPVWNFSWECTDSLCPALMDYWVTRYPWPLITIPAGNYGGGGSGATVTNASYNSLTVGGTDDSGDGQRSNDVMDTHSRANNCVATWLGRCDASGNKLDWELPNVVAPSKDQATDGQTDFDTGTSISSAQVAGVAAQMMQANSTLVTWGEAVRAIMMCTANRDVDGGRFSWNDTVDDKDGAGEVNAQLAVSLAATSGVAPDNLALERGWDGRSLTTTLNPEQSYVHYHAKTTQTGKRMRVVITWDASTTCTDIASTTAACQPTNIDCDLDLFVSSGGTTVASSESFAANWEMVEFAATANTVYDIDIFIPAWASGHTHTYYGIAWSVDDYPVN